MNAQEEAAVATFRCDFVNIKGEKCGREFSTERALQTHDIRAHKQFWITNKKKPAKLKARKPRAALNPQYVKYRDRYRAMGLNAKGKPYKNGQQTARTGRPPGPKNPNTTCPVCEKEFSTRPNMLLHVRHVHKRSIAEFQARGGGPLDPTLATESPRPRRAAAKEGREVIFCPVCGTNIHAVRTAVNFADQ